MIRTLLLAAFGLALLAVLLATLLSPGVGGPADGEPVAPPREWGRGYFVGQCRGTLTALTPTSLTLTDSVPINPGTPPPHGPTPTRFALGPALAAGTYLLDPAGGFDRTNCSQNPHYTYRLRDVLLGDKLGIYYVRVNGVEVCDEICISRRYGGRRVPPEPGRSRRYTRWEYHNKVSYMSRLEEQGLPFPDPFDPPELPPEERDPNAKPSAQ